MNRVSILYVITGLGDQELFHWKEDEYTEEEKSKVLKILPDYGWNWPDFIQAIAKEKEAKPKLPKRAKVKV